MYWFCLWPLTKEERRQQWVKYRTVGKLVYGLSYLELEEDRKKWEEHKKSGEPLKHGH